jgi:hypothetical protein
LEHDLENAFTMSDDESDEMFLATLVDPGDPTELVGPSRRGGSIPGRRFVMRDWEGWHHLLVKDYFAASPIFDDIKFRHQYRMRRSLFGCG